MYSFSYTNQFKKDIKLLKKRSLKQFNTHRLFVEGVLLKKGSFGLDKKYKAHKLSGNWDSAWECHILPDLLLIWFENRKDKHIILVRTGTHSDLF